MSEVLEEVQKAITSLGLDKEVHLFEDGADLYKSLLSDFVEGGNRRWWWESFSRPSASVTYEDGKGFERLCQFVPDPKELVWFVVEDDQMPHYPIFEATTDAVVKIIGECFGFEYYLISKDRSWLLCENHHDRVIGIGNQVVSTMARARM